MARRGLVLTWLLTLSTLTSAQPGAVRSPALSPGGSATSAGLASPSIAPAMAPVAAAAAATVTPMSAPSTGSLPTAKAVVDQAGALMQDLQQRSVQLGAQRVLLTRRYHAELDIIDRLKNQRPSWRRDRELRDNLSSSLDTANRLGAVDREAKHINLKLLSVQRAYLDAIDAELGGGPEPARVQQLLVARAPLARQFAVPIRRFVMPDLEIDPLADPEELDQRVAELRESEAELNRLLSLIDRELERVASRKLRTGERAGDEQSTVAEDPLREAAPTLHGASPVGASHASPLDGFAPTVIAAGLGGLDAAALESLAVAVPASEPAPGAAEAVHKARGAVAERLEQVQRTRAEIEARSRQLRTPR